MACRPGACEARDSDECFKTFPQVSRVLSSLAERCGISKQELLHQIDHAFVLHQIVHEFVLHQIVHEFVRREVHAAKLLVVAAESEGMGGIDGE